MTPTERTLLWIYAAIIAVWPIRHVVLWFFGRRTDFLTPRWPHYVAANPPLVSAIIPAKDEEAVLADCLESVCRQTYPNLEVLVVDDRSTDQTPQIAQRFAERDARVRLISIADLPPGWTGKTHALHVASGTARGEWLWFLDADTRHEPESLTVVMEYARSRDAVLATLLPASRCETFWEKAVQPLAGIVLMQSFPPLFVNSLSYRTAFANGQYILIERSAYDAAGGHSAVRDRFVEDIYLARAVKATGRRILLAIGNEIGSTRMYTSLPQLVRGWSRILFDAFGRRSWPLLIKMLDPLIFSQTAHVALAAAIVLLIVGVPGPFPLWLLGMSIVHHIYNFIVLARVYRMSAPIGRYAVWYPVAGLVVDWILMKAIWMCWTGRVTWRGTSYGPSSAAAPPGPAVSVATARRTEA